MLEKFANYCIVIIYKISQVIFHQGCPESVSIDIQRL